MHNKGATCETRSDFNLFDFNPFSFKIKEKSSNSDLFILSLAHTSENAVANSLFNRFLRKQLARDIGLKHTPALHFSYDNTPQTAQRIDDLLKKTVV